MPASELELLCAQMADTLRAVLMVVDQPEPYPWSSGALKHQIREDITAYELADLDHATEAYAESVKDA